MIAIGPSGVSRAELDDEQMQSATERLLESSWAQRERRASRRELAVDATAAALFVGRRRSTGAGRRHDWPCARASRRC